MVQLQTGFCYKGEHDLVNRLKLEEGTHCISDLSLAILPLPLAVKKHGGMVSV